MRNLFEHMRLVSDERKCVIALVLVLFMGLLLVYTYAGDGCRNDHEGILRLHVIANSNKVGDQALKLKVRDAVIEYMADQKDLKTVDETRKYLKENKKRLQRIAEGVIAAQGYDYPADVELGVRYLRGYHLPSRKLRGAQHHHRQRTGRKLVVRAVPTALPFG